MAKPPTVIPPGVSIFEFRHSSNRNAARQELSSDPGRWCGVGLREPLSLIAPASNRPVAGAIILHACPAFWERTGRRIRNFYGGTTTGRRNMARANLRDGIGFPNS